MVLPFVRIEGNLYVGFLAQHVSVDKLLDLKSINLNYALGYSADSFDIGCFLRSSLANCKQNL